MKENADQQFSLRSDSHFYVPGTAHRQVFTGDGSEARVQQKFNRIKDFTSKGGVLEVYKGAKP